jgi:hypothetical protein
MAKLTVQATRGSSTAVDATVSPVTLCVSVTDEEGKPVDGLSKQAFTLTVPDATNRGEADIHSYRNFWRRPVRPGAGRVRTRRFYHVGIAHRAMELLGSGAHCPGLAVKNEGGWKARARLRLAPYWLRVSRLSLARLRCGRLSLLPRYHVARRSLLSKDFGVSRPLSSPRS